MSAIGKIINKQFVRLSTEDGQKEFVGTLEELQQALDSGEIEEGTNAFIDDDEGYGDFLIQLDDELSETSEHAIKNKVVTSAINTLSDNCLLEGFEENNNLLALSHNGIYRGKNITAYYSDGSLYTRISSGKFTDIYLGDYFVDSKNVTWLVAGFDLFLNSGDTPLMSHHIVIVPKTVLGTSYMNTSNITTGGYKGSYMYATKLPEIMTTYVIPAFGSHALSHRVLISTSVNTTANSNAGAAIAGCSNNWEWSSVTADLMSEINVYGSVVCSSSFYDTGNKNMRFPLFNFDNQAVFAYRNWYWLCAVASATNFCYVNDYGHSTSNSASSASGGVRPYHAPLWGGLKIFLIKNKKVRFLCQFLHGKEVFLKWNFFTPLLNYEKN